MEKGVKICLWISASLIVLIIAIVQLTPGPTEAQRAQIAADAADKVAAKANIAELERDVVRQHGPTIAQAIMAQGYECPQLGGLISTGVSHDGQTFTAFCTAGSTVLKYRLAATTNGMGTFSVTPK